MPLSTNSLRTLKILIFFITLTTCLNAATIRGKVLDAKTNEALTGALVFNKDNILINDVAGLEGTYSIKNVAPGKYTFVARFIGFTNLEKEVNITDANEVVTVDFLLEASALNLGEYTIVTEYEKGSDNYARSLEKSSDYVMNIMSAKTIQMSPDLTIGNVLQRVSGVVVEKAANGEGRYAIIRGMDKRYNYTTIDGIKIPSPDSKNRYVPMDIFPSELVERLEVIKSLNASMEGDAIGGVVNLKLKDAPDRFICDANVSTGYSQLFFDQKFTTFEKSAVANQSPFQMYGPDYSVKNTDFPIGAFTYNRIEPAPNVLANFSIGDRFLNNKLGVILSGNYQNTFSATQSFFLTPSAQPNYVPPNGAIFDDIEERFYSTQQTRSAVHAKLDYDFNKKNKISFYTVYVRLDEFRERHTSDTVANTNAGKVNTNDETKVTHQMIYNSTLHGDHTLLPGLKFDWSGAIADASNNTPDWGTLSSTSNFVTGAPTTYSGFSRRWVYNDDKDKSAFANLTYNHKIFGQGVEFKVGGMDRNKVRSETYDTYTLDFPPYTNSSIPLNDTLYTVDSKSITGTPQNANNYSSIENIYAFYGQIKINIGKKWELLGGLRKEYTNDSFNTAIPLTINGKYGDIHYSDLLPSWSIKYALTDNQNLRASYFASITRPGFFEVVPYTITGEYFDEMGNDSLKHTQADNYDVRWEWFPKPSEEILAGVFYKNITNPIEYAFVRPPSTTSALDLQPQNFGNAKNYGFEFVAVKYYKHWGISANYTYTHSQITTDKLLYYNNPTKGNTDTLVNQTRPLQGQADHIANLSLIYKDDKMGLDVRVSAVYTGKLISQVSPDYNLDYWQMPMTRLDLSFEKKLSKKINLAVFGKVNNILNTGLVIRIEQPLPPGATSTSNAFYLPEQNDANSILVEKELYGQSYLLGLRYKF